MDLGDLALTDEDKERVGEFMSGDVAPHHEAGPESIEQREPEEATDSEEEKFFRAPVVTTEGVSGEENEEGLDEDPAKRE